jgi:hypothetical protein
VIKCVVSDSPKTVQELHRTLTESPIRDWECSEIDFVKGFDPGDGSRGVLDGGGQVALVVYVEDLEVSNLGDVGEQLLHHGTTTQMSAVADPRTTLSACGGVPKLAVSKYERSAS